MRSMGVSQWKELRIFKVHKAVNQLPQNYEVKWNIKFKLYELKRFNNLKPLVCFNSYV